MARSAAVLVLALAALTSSAAGQALNGAQLTQAAARFAKNKGGSGTRCSVGTPSISYAIDGRPGTTDHPMTPGIASQFIANQAKPQLLNHYTTTFDCVDSREPSAGFNPHLGTAGGDFAELAGGIATYFKVMNEAPSEEAIKKIFERFMNTVASPSRPFYLHTSEDKMNKVLNDVVGLVPERPASLPVVGPPPGALREAYLESLMVGDHQGCGHVRLMINQPTDYGLEDAFIPQTLLKAFYEYWWFTPVGSAQRKKIEYPILQGLLEGDAILVVNAASTTGACSHRSPSITHAWWGGQAFVYNGAAVEDFRQVKLTDFFKGVAKAEGKTLPSNFYTELAALQGQQLGFTINNLGTAKDCPVLAVTY